MDGLSNPKEIHAVRKAAKETPPEHKGIYGEHRLPIFKELKTCSEKKKAIWKVSRAITFARKNLAKGPACVGK